MPPLFKFLSTSEFEELSIDDKRAYLDAATAELERTKADHRDGGWVKLFKDEPKDAKKSD
jgi:hypothetical protein